MCNGFEWLDLRFGMKWNYHAFSPQGIRGWTAAREYLYTNVDETGFKSPLPSASARNVVGSDNALKREAKLWQTDTQTTAMNEDSITNGRNYSTTTFSQHEDKLSYRNGTIGRQEIFLAREIAFFELVTRYVIKDQVSGILVPCILNSIGPWNATRNQVGTGRTMFFLNQSVLSAASFDYFSFAAYPCLSFRSQSSIWAVSDWRNDNRSNAALQQLKVRRRWTNVSIVASEKTYKGQACIQGTRWARLFT